MEECQERDLTRVQVRTFLQLRSTGTQTETSSTIGRSLETAEMPWQVGNVSMTALTTPHVNKIATGESESKKKVL